jgi:hypothetical protein
LAENDRAIVLKPSPLSEIMQNNLHLRITIRARNNSREVSLDPPQELDFLRIG